MLPVVNLARPGMSPACYGTEGKSMTIRKRLYAGFGAVVALMLVVYGISFFSLMREHNTRAAATAALADEETLEAVRSLMMQNRLFLRNYLLSGDPREEERASKGTDDLQEMLRTKLAASDEGILKNTLQQANDSEQEWYENFAKPLIAKRHQVDAGNATVSDLQIAYLQHDPAKEITTATSIMDDGSRAIRKALDESSASAASATTISTIMTLVGTIIAVGLGLLIALLTAKSITSPMQKLIGVAREIGETGNLDQTIDIHRKDEIGVLADSFNKMMAHLKEMAAVSSAIAEGKLNIPIQPRSKQDTMANAYIRMIEGLHEIVRQVRESASQVASGSSQMASSSDESAKVSVHAASAIDEVTSTMHEMSINVQNVVKNTQMQSSSVAETSASIDQMVASIQRVADNATVLLDISKRSRNEVEAGIETMVKTTEGLNRTSSSIQASAEIIKILGGRADDIGKIIEVIDDLAEQTNLLALNAAIEAARAGEHGLGFAVVAEEVRKLAEKSTQSTREISELIQGIQKEAKRAVENMEKSTSMVQEGLLFGNDLNTALGKIANVVTEVHKFAQEIGAATTEQSHGSSQIAKATSRLTEITQEINSSVEEQASGAQGVVRAMEKMRQLVQQSTSSSAELAAAAEQMSRLSRALLDSMDRFVLEGNYGSHSSVAARWSGSGPASERERANGHRYTELARV